MPTVERENIGLLTDKITVKIQKQDYLPSFEKKLKEYSKTANIPGFRKGMVPVGMIRKMYGPSILNEEVLKTVEKQLYTYLNDEKPPIFGQPLPLETDLAKISLDHMEDYDFGFEIGLKPEFTIPDMKAVKLTRHKVVVTDAMINEEIDRMRVKAGVSKEIDAITTEDNLISVSLSEVNDQGDVIEGSEAKTGVLTLKDFANGMQEKVKALKRSDTITLQPSASLQADKLEAILDQLGLDKGDADKQFKLTVEKIEGVENAEVNVDFFKKIFPGKEIADENQFRNELRTEMEAYWDSQSRNQLHDQIYHALIDDTKMEFPEAFLKRWLRQAGEKPKTAEEAEREFPGFSNQLKWTLISERLTTENNLDVSKEELQAGMRSEVMNYFGQMSLGDDTSWLDSYIDRMMKDEKQVDATYRRMVTTKLFEWLEQQATPEEQPITPDELLKIQHHHAH